MADVDEHLFRACYGGPAGGPWLFLMVAATVLGSGWTMLLLVPFLVRQRTRRVAAVLTGTLVACATIVFATKVLVGRARPCAQLHDVRALWFMPPTDFSFPSGHAAGSFCVAAFVGIACIREARRNPARAALLYGAASAVALLALVIAYSRVYLGVHFPGDVSGGALIGSVVGLGGARVHARLASGSAIDPE